MHKSIFLFFFLFVSLAVFAQDESETAPVQQQQPTVFDLEMRKAERVFLAKKFNTAAGMFKKLYPKAKDEDQQQKVLYYIAESYRQANNFKQAFEWYEKLVNTKYPDPRILYSYGLLLKNFERYDDAARQFNDYLFEVPGDKEAEREMQSCKTAQEWKLNPKKFAIKNVKELNTQYSDYAPFYTANKLIWASSRTEATGNEIFEWTGQKCSDFFEASYNGSAFGKVANLKGGVNTNFNEGVAWIDSTATIMYFTQCNGMDGKGVNCKIYVSYFQGNEWTKPTVLPFCSDSFSTGHPAMTADQKRMYFASNMPGTMGEKDIFSISYDPVKDKWGTPVNLGPNVNSTQDDMFPFVDDKGALYFASKGHKGMGGLDLYVTGDSAGTFKKAQNLQYPINSGGDDFGITFLPASATNTDGPIGYLCSNREGGEGDDDIYSISIKPFVFVVKGKVIDKETNSALPGANVDFTKKDGAIAFSARSGNNGDFVTELSLNELYKVNAGKDKYFKSTDQMISTEGVAKDSTVEITIYLDPIPSEEYEFTLQGIYYDLDKADLRPEAKKILDSLIVILRNNPTLVIELASHTDSRAEADYNIKLSQRRAQSCVDYLMQNGIPKDRLKPVGYGETKLVNDCADGVDCTEEEHQQNRRTTFRVLSTDYKPKR